MSRISGRQRDGVIELLRIVFCVVLMIYHLYYIGITDKAYFKNGWICVEYFFAITGFYTAKHFLCRNINVTTGYLFSYIAKKFYPLWGSVVIAVLCQVVFVNAKLYFFGGGTIL